MASCFRPDGSWRPLSFSGEHCESGASGEKLCCSFFQKAGQLWVARLHQYLLASGIAVLVVNPYAGDTWQKLEGPFKAWCIERQCLIERVYRLDKCID